ncbi:MAG TPA: hypothetical protein PK792_09875, partial [Methanothrix soehngenii]|nr:hypothetical protein [Methanothrix soehngenii]
ISGLKTGALSTPAPQHCRDGEKTYENIRQTGEFVVNVPPAGMEDAVMVSARSYPPEVDEFLAAGIAPR